MVLTLLFSLRVCGQIIQRWWPTPVLPDFDAWQGSSLAYPVLLAIQLLILAVMLIVAWRIGRGALSPNRRVGHWLGVAGGVYMAGSALRVIVGLLVADAPSWFSTWIPAGFHLVLAAFVLVVAHFHLQSAAPP